MNRTNANLTAVAGDNILQPYNIDVADKAITSPATDKKQKLLNLVKLSCPFEIPLPEGYISWTTHRCIFPWHGKHSFIKLFHL